MRIILFALLGLAPAAAGAQGLAIDHKQVGCIVVGKFPRMDACFNPAADLARSRVYFRPEGSPSWYYVEMKPEEPCHAGVLPKPGKKLVGTKIEYYVEAQDRTFNPARTAEFSPMVVESAGECEKDVPVAPFVNNATVAVFPSVPAGFVGSAAVATSTIVGVAAAGAAVAGTAAVVAASGDDATTTTTVVGGITTTTLGTTTTTSTTTTTTLPRTNRPPLARLATSPDPPEGPGPLTVTFDMCGSSDPDGDPLSFFFDFGDGAMASGVGCSTSHTYSATFRSTGARAATRTYTFTGSAVDPSGASQSRTREVTARDPAPACGPAPTVTIVEPMPSAEFRSASGGGGCLESVSVDADATNADKVTFFADYDESCGDGGAPVNVARLEVFPPGFSGTMDLSGESSGCYRFRAVAVNQCSGATAEATVENVFLGCCKCAFRITSRGRTAGWAGTLSVEGGALQVLVNDKTASLAAAGRSQGVMELAEGENRVEATLRRGSGTPGLWRFEFLGPTAVAAGSIRPIAGEAVEVGPASVTFRLAGTPGERVAFTFRKE